METDGKTKLFLKNTPQNFSLKIVIFYNFLELKGKGVAYLRKRKYSHKQVFYFLLHGEKEPGRR